MKEYKRIECGRKSIMKDNIFFESVIHNTPELSYEYQIYNLVNGIILKKHYRKTLSAACKVQNKNIGE